MQGTIIAARAKTPAQQELLSPPALVFLSSLVTTFAPRAFELVLGRGAPRPAPSGPRIPAEWMCTPPPRDLARRRVELVGPASELGLRAAAHCRPSAFVADLDDATAHNWANVLDAQRQLAAALRGGIDLPPILFRPRALDADEHNLLVDGQPAPAALVDVGLYAFHNAATLAPREAGPFFSLTKLQDSAEARFWNDVLGFVEAQLGLEPNTCKASVRIDTMQAALEAEEILWALRTRSLGLACGREELIRDLITQRSDEGDAPVTPDRHYLTVDRPPLMAMTSRLVEICHARGVPIVGPITREVPFDSDHETARNVYSRVCAETVRTALAGFDGTRVVHGSLVPVARAALTIASNLPRRGRGKNRFVRPEDLALLHAVEPTEDSVRETIRMCLLQLEASLGGRARIAHRTFVEDNATARAARAQLWEWGRRGVRLQDRARLDAARFRVLCNDEAAHVGSPSYVRALLQHACTARSRAAFEAATALLVRSTREVHPGAP